MIELTAQGGDPIALNEIAVWHIRPAAAQQTAIYSMSGAALFVSESYTEVLKRLGWRSE